MANESPEVLSDREGMLHPPLGSVKPGVLDTEYISANIQRLLDNRLADDASINALEKRTAELRDALSKTLSGEKSLRIERVKACTKRDRLRARALELKRERLSKDAKVASRKVRLSEKRKEAAQDHQAGVNMLEERIHALNGDLDAFRETLMLHRRDRDRVLDKLITARSVLQDKLTECMLWKIVLVDESGYDDEAIGRKGISGVTAELLGRLLVLEKEECQICSLLNRWNFTSNGESANH